MAVRLTRASSGLIAFTAGTFNNWPFGTLAAVVRRASFGTDYHVMFGCRDTTGSADGFGMQFNPSNQLELWSETAGAVADSTATVTTSDWYVVAITKATGSQTPRAHLFNWATGTWTHQAMSAALVDNADFGFPVWIGTSNPAFNSYFDGDVAAVMALTGRVMSDGEIERLPRGEWSRYVNRGDQFLAEFPTWPIPTAGAGASCQALVPTGMRSSTVTGVSRSAVAHPPGFRFSIDNRRR